MMTRIFQGDPFPLGAAALAVALLAVAFVLAPRKPRRPVPGLPGDGDPLECWERDEIVRMEAFYAASADDPASPGRPS